MPLCIKNIGAGPALNIRWKTLNGKNWVEEPVLASGESRLTLMRIKTILNGGRAVTCVYESMSRRGYQTETGFSENTQDLQLRHSFKELCRPRDAPRIAAPRHPATVRALLVVVVERSLEIEPTGSSLDLRPTQVRACT
jgi:hypothetical protein